MTDIIPDMAERSMLRRVAEAVLFPERFVPECPDDCTVAEWQAMAVLAIITEPTIYACHVGAIAWDETEAASDAEKTQAARRVWKAMIKAATNG